MCRGSLLIPDQFPTQLVLARGVLEQSGSQNTERRDVKHVLKTVAAPQSIRFGRLRRVQLSPRKWPSRRLGTVVNLRGLVDGSNGRYEQLVMSHRQCNLVLSIG